MKIIGLNGKGGFLVEMSPDELHRITTFNSPPVPEVDYNGRSTLIGKEVDLSPSLERLHNLSRSKNEISEAIRSLRGVADFLEPLPDLIDQEVFDKPPTPAVVDSDDDEAPF